MSTLFLSEVLVIRNRLVNRKKNWRRLPAQGRGKRYDTITIFEQEQQKRVRQMAYWGIGW